MPKPVHFRRCMFKIAEDGGYPQIVQDNGDGTFTRWGFTIYGPVGFTATPKEGVVIREPKTKRDRQLVDQHIRLLERAMQSQQVTLTVAKCHREITSGTSVRSKV